jgi:hypothetical protein
MTSPPDLLNELRSGRDGAFDQLIPLVYEELRGIAGDNETGWRDQADHPG